LRYLWDSNSVTSDEGFQVIVQCANKITVEKKQTKDCRLNYKPYNVHCSF